MNAASEAHLAVSGKVNVFVFADPYRIQNMPLSSLMPETIGLVWDLPSFL